MERERTALTAHELRVLAAVESGLRRDDPGLVRVLGRRRRQTAALVATTAGIVLIAIGLLADVVADRAQRGFTVVAFVGFALLVGGMNTLVQGWNTAAWWQRARSSLGLDAAVPPAADQP